MRERKIYWRNLETICPGKHDGGIKHNRSRLIQHLEEKKSKLTKFFKNKIKNLN